jgi:molybdopterin synthase sulfur carrier subunit
MMTGENVGEIIDAAIAAWGFAFSTLLASSQVWVNGEVADRSTVVGHDDEVAVIPPVSGGAV